MRKAVDRFCYSIGMLRTRPFMRFGIYLLFALGMTSCAGEIKPLGPVELAGRQASRILVAPLNMALSLAPRLETSTQIVDDAMARQIGASGKTLERLDYRLARSLWVKAANQIRQSGGEQTFEAAAQVFARLAAERIEFDALIIASLYLQNAQVGVRYLRWDSASQEMTFIGRPRGQVEMPPLSTVPAASIHVSVLDSAGAEIHTRRTGIELIQHMEIQLSQRKGRDKQKWILVDDDPAIEDPVRVRAAITHALSPFLRN